MATNTSRVEGGYGGASGKKLMASGRFDGGPKEKYMRDTAVALQAMGEEVLIVTAGGGAKFGKQTMSCLYNMQIMVAFVTEDYGEKTDSAYCTYNEIEYCADHEKPVIPIKLYAGAWPPRPGGEGDAQNAFFFTPTLVYIDGVGKSAEELARDIATAATDSHDAVTKREAAVAIQAAQRGKQARQAMSAGVGYPAEWEARIGSLTARFPDKTREEIISAMHEVGGHGGKAAGILVGRPVPVEPRAGGGRGAAASTIAEGQPPLATPAAEEPAAKGRLNLFCC